MLNWFALLQCYMVLLYHVYIDSSVISRVSQDTVLWPLPLMIYVTSTAYLFAYDCLLYRIISSTIDTMVLQQDLNLQKWAFNHDRCEVLCVTNKHKITPATHTMPGHQLKQVEWARYLGGDIDSRLTFKSHVDLITKQASRTNVFLQCNTNSPPSPSHKIKASCYAIFVQPQLEYASTVRSPHTERNINKVEAGQRQSARYVMKDYSRYSGVTTMLQELVYPRTEMISNQTHYVLQSRTWTYRYPSTMISEASVSDHQGLSAEVSAHTSHIPSYKKS